MKKVLIITILLSVFYQKNLAQNTITDSTDRRELSDLLSNYYAIKDALVAGNGTIASAQAETFIKTANSIDYKLISEGNINALLKDATAISDTKDIKVQRQHFAGLSENMAGLTKTLKYADQPVYKAYCPMKKASWLTNEKVIKNPYYGNAMLSCGSIVETY